jgi:hypothetical protein
MIEKALLPFDSISSRVKSFPIRNDAAHLLVRRKGKNGM